MKFRPTLFSFLTVIFIGWILLFFSLSLLKKNTQTNSKAYQPQNLSGESLVKSAKSFARLCLEAKGMPVTPFSDCPGGSKRLSNVADDPLFYCCK